MEPLFVHISFPLYSPSKIHRCPKQCKIDKRLYTVCLHLFDITLCRTFFTRERVCCLAPPPVCFPPPCRRGRHTDFYTCASLPSLPAPTAALKVNWLPLFSSSPRGGRPVRGRGQAASGGTHTRVALATHRNGTLPIKPAPPHATTSTPR